MTEPVFDGTSWYPECGKPVVQRGEDYGPCGRKPGHEGPCHDIEFKTMVLCLCGKEYIYHDFVKLPILHSEIGRVEARKCPCGATVYALLAGYQDGEPYYATR